MNSKLLSDSLLIKIVIVILIIALGITLGWGCLQRAEYRKDETQILQYENRLAQAVYLARQQIEDIQEITEKLEEVRRVEIQGMDARDVVITFLEPADMDAIADATDSITGQAVCAIVEYLRGVGIDFVTIHHRSDGGGGEDSHLQATAED